MKMYSTKETSGSGSGSGSGKGKAWKIGGVLSCVLVACIAITGVVMAVLGYLDAQSLLHGKRSVISLTVESKDGKATVRSSDRSACDKVKGKTYLFEDDKSSNKEAYCVISAPFTKVASTQDFRCSQYPDVKAVVKDEDKTQAKTEEDKERYCWIKGSYSVVGYFEDACKKVANGRFVSSSKANTNLGMCLVPRHIEKTTVVL